ncbi:MAG: hypothetical protein V4710_23840 [Verrucomicrobiota bacterium]
MEIRRQIIEAARLPKMRQRAGFTLLEIFLAITISLLLLGLALPSVAGMLSKQKLDATFERFDDFVQQAQILSVSERRAFVIIWEKNGLVIEPDEPIAEDRGKNWAHLDFEKETILTIQRPVALEKKPPMEWIFWRSGTCEPVIINYEGPAGAWTATYDALTARANFELKGLP